MECGITIYVNVAGVGLDALNHHNVPMACTLLRHSKLQVSGLLTGRIYYVRLFYIKQVL